MNVLFEDLADQVGLPTALRFSHLADGEKRFSLNADCLLHHDLSYRTFRAQQRLNSEPKAKSPGDLAGRGFCCLIGQLPTLPHTRACSTIGAEGLNFRVRDGNGWVPLAMITQNRGEPLEQNGSRTFIEY